MTLDLSSVTPADVMQMIMSLLAIAGLWVRLESRITRLEVSAADNARQQHEEHEQVKSEMASTRLELGSDIKSLFGLTRALESDVASNTATIVQHEKRIDIHRAHIDQIGQQAGIGRPVA